MKIDIDKNTFLMFPYLSDKFYLNKKHDTSFFCFRRQKKAVPYNYKDVFDLQNDFFFLNLKNYLMKILIFFPSYLKNIFSVMFLIAIVNIIFCLLIISEQVIILQVFHI